MRGTVVILTVFAFSCAVMTAQDKTVVKGELGPEGAPKEVDFFYRSGESVSVPVENGRFRVELPTDVTKSYDVGMGRHVKVTIVPEGGTLTISRRPDGRCTVSSDKVNSLTVALDSLMSFRRRNYKDSTLMINEYKRVIHSPSSSDLASFSARVFKWAIMGCPGLISRILFVESSPLFMAFISFSR